jgi:hypothetical protein
MWVFWALFALIGFVASIKATTERVTWSWLQRCKAKRARRALAQRQDALLQDMASRHTAADPGLAAAAGHG